MIRSTFSTFTKHTIGRRRVKKLILAAKQSEETSRGCKPRLSNPFEFLDHRGWMTLQGSTVLRNELGDNCAISPYASPYVIPTRSEEHTSELQSLRHLV